MQSAPEEVRRIDEASGFRSGFLDTLLGGGGSIADIYARAEAAFPFSYDRGANNGNGQYTWNSNSFGNETLAAVDASKQFPDGGFLGGGFGEVMPSTSLLVSGGGGSPAASATPAVAPVSTAPIMPWFVGQIPAWVWWVLLALVVLSFIPVPKKVRIPHVR